MPSNPIWFSALFSCGIRRRLTISRAIASNSTLALEPSYSKPTNQSSRRLSIASTTGSVISDAPSVRPVGQNRAISNGTSDRPGSSQSVRPDSSMSSRGHSIPPVVVKKTRAPTQPRPEGPKSSRVRRKSPLNTDAAAPDRHNGTAEPNSRNGSAPVRKIEATSSDMDELTSGLKKIKLSLTTKAQREAKEQAKLSNGAAPQPAPRKPTAPRQDGNPLTQPLSKHEVSTSATSNNDLHVPDQLPSHSPATLQPLQPNAQPSFLAPTQPTAQQTLNPLTYPTPTLPSHSAQSLPTTIPNTPDIFIPYQPEGPQPDTMVQQEPLQWLPPNTSTPSPLKRVDLPVFTATGAIPFGVNPALSGQKKRTGERSEDIWEVPETPSK